MPRFSATDISRFFDRGENDISDDVPFLVDRVSLNLIGGTAVYTLPDYVRSIKRVTYLGMKVDPLPRRNFREVFQSATQQGQPFWYIYNNVGLNQIQLFPAPNGNVPTVTDLWKSGIPNGCIVEFYRVTDNNIFVIPPYIRRQMLKQYVATQCYSIDGPGVNLKLAKYFGQKWEMKKKQFADLVSELYSKPRKLVVDDIVGSNYFPASPVLPIAQFGTSVDDGE